MLRMTGRPASHDEMTSMRGQEYEEISQISDRVRQSQSMMNIKKCPLMSFGKTVKEQTLLILLKTLSRVLAHPKIAMISNKTQ